MRGRGPSTVVDRSLRQAGRPCCRGSAPRLGLRRAAERDGVIDAHDTAAEIREALSIERTADSTAAVKRAVARSLRAVDAGVTIETTEYFNHSFAPDLVLKWQRAP